MGGVITTYIYNAQGELAEEIGGPSNPLAGQTTYLTSDALGSTRLVTNVSGSPLARYDYAQFGEELNSGMDGRGSTLLNNHYPVPGSDGTSPKITEQVRDPDTGLDYFNARYTTFFQAASPSPDSLGNFVADARYPQSWNLYSYAENNPLLYVDSTGFDACQLSDGALENSPETGRLSQEQCQAVGGTWFVPDLTTTAVATPPSQNRVGIGW